MPNRVAKSREQPEINDSRESREDFLTVLSEVLSQPAVGEPEESDWNIEVADIYNRVASNYNLRSYFEQAKSALGLIDSQDIPLSDERRSTSGFLDYVVPGKPRFSNDDAWKLYLHVFRSYAAAGASRRI